MAHHCSTFAPLAVLRAAGVTCSVLVMGFSNEVSGMEHVSIRMLRMPVARWTKRNVGIKPVVAVRARLAVANGRNHCQCQPPTDFVFSGPTAFADAGRHGGVSSGEGHQYLPQQHATCHQLQPAKVGASARAVPRARAEKMGRVRTRSATRSQNVPSAGATLL